MTDAESLKEFKDRRVKVYKLNAEGQWDDKGTGHVTLNPIPEEQSFEMVVQCEENQTMLLEHRVQRDIDYARQGETIITWCQAENPDLALSFQEAAGCKDVWNRIVAIIGAREDQDAGGGLQAMQQVEPLQLPEPSEENMEAILKAITETPANQREFVATALLKDDYLKKLLAVFEEVDKAGNSKACILFFELFKHIVLLNEISIYEILFSDEIFKLMVAVFDHDPTIREENKMQHRAFLAKAKFKQVMDIKEPGLVKKIHENYRMIYFKDAVLLRFLDDGALNTLGSLIYYNNATIISHITEYPDLVRNLFKKINAALRSIDEYRESGSMDGGKGSPEDTDAKDPFLFLQDLCNIVKQMQVPQRDSFYNTMVEADVFSSVEDALWAASPQRYPWVWQASVDILHNMLIHDSALLRRFLVNRIPSKKSLLTRIVTMIVSEQCTPGLVHQLGEILRMVLDPDAMQTSDKDVFLDHFYSMNAAHLEVALTAEASSTSTGSGSGLGGVAPASTKYNAVEMFTMCAKQHGYRAKAFILGHGILQKAVKLIAVRDKQLTLSVIRLIRTCLGSKEAAYAKRVEQHRLLDPIIELFMQNGARYNLLNSNVIELIDLIHRENIKNLISYLMLDHGAKFEKITYVDTFKMLAVQHKTNTEQDSTMDSKDEKMQPPNDGINEDANCEYTYFEGNDDDEEEEKAPDMDLDNENDGFIARKPMEEDKEEEEDDLMATISKRKKGGKLRKMKALPKKISIANRKNPLDKDVVDMESESPRKKRRVEDLKT
mmetsp:Transcript_20974/g.37366  ORF Transcript_20974/g.37366 Transcript_20974/m.37366 type:complete len:777 (+) Transcript_20974:75-2405(+)